MPADALTVCASISPRHQHHHVVKHWLTPGLKEMAWLRLQRLLLGSVVDSVSAVDTADVPAVMVGGVAAVALALAACVHALGPRAAVVGVLQAALAAARCDYALAAWATPWGSLLACRPVRVVGTAAVVAATEHAVTILRTSRWTGAAPVESNQDAAGAVDCCAASAQLHVSELAQ